ncbi:MAG: hypothetical protein JXR49_16480 [Acidobacteria bacterium]|nr:hypothetical protein [Acidobacteriota bacterium]
MKIAYLILAHQQPALLHRLVYSLNAPNTQFLIHIDLKADIEQFKRGLECGNASFLGDRIKVNYGGYTQMLAMLALLKAATSTDDFDYCIFLSGQDYPIKSNTFIFDYLAKHTGTNYINFYPLTGNAALTRNIRKYYFVDLLNAFNSKIRPILKNFFRIVNLVLPERAFVKGMIPYRGSTSWCLTGQTAKYIVDFAASPDNSNFVSYFKRVMCPDEIFFQTVVLNSPFASKCRFYDRDVLTNRIALMNENKAYLHYVDWDGSRDNPAILDMRDYNNLKCSDRLFARKFDEFRSKELLDNIDLHLR